jgi:glucosamine-6-phosphate deaminase
LRFPLAGTAQVQDASTPGEVLPAMKSPRPVSEFQVDELQVKVFEDRRQLGAAAAESVAQALIARIAANGEVRVVFAAAPSQDEFLAELARIPGLDWSRVLALHMDEYLGIGPDHPMSFRKYLAEHIFQPVGLRPDRLRLIPAEQPGSPLRVCLDYEEILRSTPPDLVCAGIGENGHLAFNDPPVADFLDPVLVKVIRLDEACRRQQVHDVGLSSIDEVPTHAYTMTVPALLSAPIVSVVVPGPRKADAVRQALRGPISEACPATALRRHPGAILYLDRDSARDVL